MSQRIPARELNYSKSDASSHGDRRWWKANLNELRAACPEFAGKRSFESILRTMRDRLANDA